MCKVKCTNIMCGIQRVLTNSYGNPKLYWDLEYYHCPVNVPSQSISVPTINRQWLFSLVFPLYFHSTSLSNLNVMNCTLWTYKAYLFRMMLWYLSMLYVSVVQSLSLLNSSLWYAYNIAILLLMVHGLFPVLDYNKKYCT